MIQDIWLHLLTMALCTSFKSTRILMIFFFLVWTKVGTEFEWNKQEWIK